MNVDGFVGFIAFMIALVVVLLVAMAAILLPRVLRVWSVERPIRCPVLDRDVVVRFLTSDGREAIEIFSCTAFADPSIVACPKSCLSELEAGATT
jgi:hypothetical protein